MPPMPRKLKLLVGLWVVLALLSVLAFNPIEFVVSILVIHGLLRGGDGSRWYMKLSALGMLGMGSLLAFVLVTGHVSPNASVEPLVVAAYALAVVITALPGGCTLLGLRDPEILKALDQRYIARLEAKLGPEE